MLPERQGTLFDIRTEGENYQWLRAIYNHNPFYVVSACLVLYGIHLSFAQNSSVLDGWLLLKLFGVYTSLLVVAAICIVRVGDVWEDARTIVVLVLMLLVALSASFDRICLDSEPLGQQIQVIGFLIATMLITILIRGMRAKLPWRYRGPLFTIYATLFAYPAWLGHLSLTGQDQRMSWYVFLFPAIISGPLLMLWPAARSSEQAAQDNGTPWSWPHYPWCGLAFLVVAIVVRSYGVSVSFELAGGLTSSFHLYFLVPLALTVVLLSTEIFLAAGLRSVANVVAFSSVAIVLTAMPGHSISQIQNDFLSVVCQEIGAPIQWTCLLLISYLAYCMFREISTAEPCAYLIGLLFAFVNDTSIAWDALSSPSVGYIVAIGIIAIVRSLQRECSLRFLFGCVVLGIGFVESDVAYVEHRLIVAAAFGMSSILLLGLLFKDVLAQLVQRYANLLVWGFAAYAILRLGTFRERSPVHVLAILGVLAVVLAAYWWRERTSRRLFHLLVQLCLFFGFGAASGGSGRLRRLIYDEGGRWISVGMMSLLIAFALSLMKAGAINGSRKFLESLNRLLAARLP